MSGNGLGVEQRQRTATVLAPQLRASLQILQMNSLALAEAIRREADTNPMLELESPEAVATVGELQDEAPENGAELEFPEDEFTADALLNRDERAAERRQQFFDRQTAKESLFEHLNAQIPLAGFTEREAVIAGFLVADIDEDGRFVGSFADLEMVLGCSEAELEAVLGRVQQFDPPGIGGRDLGECLRLQLRTAEGEVALRRTAEAIVTGYLRELGAGQYPAIAAALGVSEAECRRAAALIRTLDPKPGRLYEAAGHGVQTVTPELKVAVGEGGQWNVEFIGAEDSRVRISPYYHRLLDERQLAPEALEYLRERLRSANSFLEAISRRRETILAIAREIIKAQPDFPVRGFDGLKPLTLEMIAERTGVHGTTVGRTVTGKYIQTPRGTFELRRFFCVGHLGEGDAAVSATAIRRRIAEIIDGEDRAHPLSDQAIAARLAAEKVRISRRTVAKYRAAQGIAGALERATHAR